MNRSPHDIQRRFGVAYGRLCHFVALRRDHSSIAAAEDGVIRAAMFLCENGEAPDLDEIIENAKAFFSLTFSREEIERSIDRLVEVGQAERVGDGARLLRGTLDDVDKIVRKAQESEQTIRDEWAAELQANGLVESQDADDAWRALQSYLAALFTRHGVQTLELIAPEFIDDESVDMPASEILDHIVAEMLPKRSRRKGREIVRSFLTDRTPLRDEYLTELLDATFSFFALTVDEETRELLRKNLPPLKLLVDTNFLFGLLDLHSNAFVAVSKDVVAVVSAEKLPFQLYYHPLTVDEFRSVLDFSRRRLAGGRWTSTVSRALLKVGDLSGIDRRYHELNAQHPTLVDDFFARYDNLERVLDSHGIKPYRNSYESWLDDEETLNLVSRYKRFIEPNEKYFTVLRHDIILWRTLRDMRRHDPGPFGTGAFFLTCDYSLWRFDHQQLNRGTSGVTVLPNVFMQLLRPFIPRTANFDASFVSTFALPEFRTIRSATGKAVQRVASVIRLYADLPEELAEKILSDEVLIKKVSKIREDDPAIVDLIESAIADEALRLKHDRDRLNDELTKQKEETAIVSRTLTEAAQSADDRLLAIKNLQDELVIAKAQVQTTILGTTKALDALSTQEKTLGAKVSQLEAQRTAAREDAARAAREANDERTRRAALTRKLAAVLHILIGAASVITFLLISPDKVTKTLGVVIAIAYAVAGAALEVWGWGAKADHAWWGRVCIGSVVIALGAGLLIRDDYPRLGWVFIGAAVAAALALLRDVMPKSSIK